MSAPYDRPASEPGGMECMECGKIFVGAEWHDQCAVCANNGWIPIENAPRDGTEVLLYGPGVLISDGRSSIYAKAHHVGWWDGEFWSTRDPRVTCRATQWQPLPANPHKGIAR